MSTTRNLFISAESHCACAEERRQGCTLSHADAAAEASVHAGISPVLYPGPSNGSFHPLPT